MNMLVKQNKNEMLQLFKVYLWNVFWHCVQKLFRS